jgi:hypothetical protein
MSLPSQHAPMRPTPCSMGYAGNGLARERFVKLGCVNAKVRLSARTSACAGLPSTKCSPLPQIYTNTFNMLQQTLGAVRKVDLQQLVVKFGCASIR